MIVLGGGCLRFRTCEFQIKMDANFVKINNNKKKEKNKSDLFDSFLGEYPVALFESKERGEHGEFTCK